MRIGQAFLRLEPSFRRDPFVRVLVLRSISEKMDLSRLPYLGIDRLLHGVLTGPELGVEFRILQLLSNLGEGGPDFEESFVGFLPILLFQGRELRFGEIVDLGLELIERRDQAAREAPGRPRGDGLRRCLGAGWRDLRLGDGSRRSGARFHGFDALLQPFPDGGQGDPDFEEVLEWLLAVLLFQGRELRFGEIVDLGLEPIERRDQASPGLALGRDDRRGGCGSGRNQIRQPLPLARQAPSPPPA